MLYVISCIIYLFHKFYNPFSDFPSSSDLFKFYAQRVYVGKPKKAKKAFGKLEPEERKRIKGEFKRMMDDYLKKLEVYLSSLTKEVTLHFHKSNSFVTHSLSMFTGNHRVRQKNRSVCPGGRLCGAELHLGKLDE